MNLAKTKLLLKLQMLQTMEPNSVFSTGTAPADTLGLGLPQTEGAEAPTLLRWCAVRGSHFAWAIYALPADRDVAWICAYGDKIHDPEILRRLVPCTDAAFAVYRH